MGEKRGLFVIAMALSVITSAMQIINPMLSQKLIDDVITPQDTTFLLPILGLMMVVQLSRLVMRYTMVVLLEKSSQCAFNGLRRTTSISSATRSPGSPTTQWTPLSFSWWR